MTKVKLRASKNMLVRELLEENNISRKLIRSLKAKGNIKKDNKVILVNKEIKKGDIITIFLDDEKSDITPVNIPLNIKYIDDDVMVIDKNYGISVMSTMNLKEDTLLNGIEYYLRSNNINSKIHIINRLDRNTTGLMLIALNRYSASLISQSLKDNIKRKYYALIEGKLDIKEDIIYNKIAKVSMMMVRRCVRNDGKEAITKYKVIKEYNNYSLLEIELLTGRTHQIRVTFEELNHPLVGDELYNINYNNEELMLHSYYLEYNDIHTGKANILTTDIPERFINFLKEKGEI